MLLHIGINVHHLNRNTKETHFELTSSRQERGAKQTKGGVQDPGLPFSVC